MQEWWTGLAFIEKALWTIAIPFSIITIIQFVFSIIGLDHHGHDSIDGIDNADLELSDADMDFDSSEIDTAGDLDIADHADVTDFQKKPSFQFFTLRGITAFFTMFAWSGIALLEKGASIPIMLLAAVGFGVMAMLSVSGLYFLFSRMTQSGTFNIYASLETEGEVYLPIEPERAGIGKIMLDVDGRLRELEALYDGPDELKTGTKVRVVNIINGKVLVEPV